MGEPASVQLADVLPLEHPRLYKCDNCKAVMLRSMKSNKPAYCQYSCGVNAQSERSKHMRKG